MRHAELFSRFIKSVSPFRQPHLQVVKTIRTMRGQCRSKLALCDDGGLYVVKEEDQLSNPNLLANEVIGSCLLRGLGITVPENRVIVSKTTGKMAGFLGDPLEQAAIRPGLHLGSRYAGCSGVKVYDYLAYQASDFDRYEVLGVLLFDLWCMNLDARQYLYVIDNTSRKRQIVFIDNSEICGGPNWLFEKARRGRPFVHSQLDPDLAPGYVSGWRSLFNQRIPALLEMTLREVPETWYKGDLGNLGETLRTRLTNLDEIVEVERCRQKEWREYLDVQTCGAEVKNLQ